MAEIPQQNSQNKPERQKLTLSPEQQIQLQKEKEQVLILSKAQRGSLSNEVIINYLQKFHHVDISKYPKDIQQKFIEEIQMIFGEFKDFDESMITRLREIRENMSFGQETGKTNDYYRNMILGNKINTRITILQELLNTINGERIKIGNTEYNKQDYNVFQTEIHQIDQTNGINLLEKIHFDDYKFNLKQVFAQEIKKQIDPSNSKYNLIMTDLMRLPQIIGEKGFENLKNIKLKNGQTVNLEEIYQTYNKNYTEFKRKNKVFEFGNKQMKISEKGFGLEEKQYGIGYDALQELYQEKLGDVEKMGTADLIIMMRILFGIVPVFGDAVGGYDDMKQANAGINFDGSLQKTWETALGYASPVLGVLSVIGVGYGIKVALNSPKYAKIIVTIGKIVDKLSRGSGLVELGKNEKVMKMLEMMKGVVPKVEELLEKMKGIKTEINPKIEVKGKVEKLPVQKASNDEKYGNVVQLKTKEIPDNLYNSHFSTEIPESLKAQNPLAWIDELGQIHYNQTIIESKFGVKIRTEDGKTLFDGKNLKDHKKALEILDYLKELKAHEVTHRILESKGIQELKVGGKIYSQEQICYIIDGSIKLSEFELKALEIALKEKFGADFKLLKNGQIDADLMRRYDAKLMVKGGDFGREAKAAKGDIGMYEKIESSTSLNSELITTALTDNYALAPEILRKYKQLKNNPSDIPGLSDEIVIRLLFSPKSSYSEKMYVGASFLNNLDCFNIHWDSELGHSLIRLGKEYIPYAQGVSDSAIPGDFAIAVIKSGNGDGLLSLSKNIDLNSDKFKRAYELFRSGDFREQVDPDIFQFLHYELKHIHYKSREKVLDILRAYSPKNIEGMKNNLRLGIKNIDGFSTGREGAIAQLFVELERDFGIKIDARMSNNEMYTLLPNALKSDKTFIDDFFLLLNFERFHTAGFGIIDLSFMSPELSRRIGNNIEFLKKNAIYNPNANSSSRGKDLKFYMSENISQDYDVFKQFVLDGKFGEFGKIVYGFFDHHSSNSSLKDFVKLDSFKVGSYGEYTSYRAKNYMIYKDMIQMALKSNSEGLLYIIKNLEGGDMIAQKAKNGQTLLESENLLLNDYYNNIGLLLHAIGYPGIKDINIRHFGYGKTYDQMLQILGAKGSQSLSDRTVEICFGMLGFKDLKSIQLEMARFKQISQTKGVDFYNSIVKNGGHVQFQEGDLVRAFDSKHLDGDIKNGQFSGEMILNSRYADNTRFDLDMVVLGKEDLIGGFNKDFSEATSGGPSSKSDLSQYGDIKMVIRKEYADANFIKAGSNYSLPTTSRKVGEYIKDNRRELNYNYVQFKNQVGVRTGVSINEVDYFIVQTTDQEKLNTLFKTFANNGVYIPIVDKDGKVIFTPEMFENLQGLTNEIKTPN